MPFCHRAACRGSLRTRPGRTARARPTRMAGCSAYAQLVPAVLVASAGSHAGPFPSPRPAHPAKTSPHQPLTPTSIAIIAAGALVAVVSAGVCGVSFRKRSVRHHKAGYLRGLTTATDDAGDDDDDDDALFEGTGTFYEDDCAL